MKHALFALLVVACGSNAQPTHATTGSLPTASATTPADAPTAPCVDKTVVLAWLLERAQSGDSSIAQLARTRLAGDDELTAAANELVQTAAGQDVHALSRALVAAQILVTKNKPTCTPTPNVDDAGAPHGRLPPPVIQWIVRANFPRVKGCYIAGLKRDPKLAGRTSTRFVINRDGHVEDAHDVASPDDAIPDEAVRKCVAQAFGALEFPRPAGGIVTVVYPLVFKPGD